MNSKSQYFITGIGTDVGKTVVSSVMVRALTSDYWKPVQSGDLDNTDTMKVQQWSGVTQKERIYKERYLLNRPMSPHAAANIDNVEIQLSDFALPITNNNLIVEGAGGLGVPLNNQHTILDLIEQLGLPVILVVRNYLGSINHSLLSIDALKQSGIAIKGIVLFGDCVKSSEDVIVEMTQIPILFRIYYEGTVDTEFVTRESNRLKETILAL